MPKAANRPTTAYKSTTEEKFAHYLNGLGCYWLYEPVRLCLVPGGKSGISYTPDFLAIIDNEIRFYEVKGSWKARGASSTRKSLKMAANKYWFFRWFGVTPKGKTWIIEPITPTKDNESC